MKKNFAIVGVGLIGGSLALKCRKNGLANRIVGVDSNQEHGMKAIELGLVDEMMPLDEAILMADVIVLAVPVGVLSTLIPYVLDRVSHQVVIDMGSTKSQLANLVKNHPHRGRFVASHPMWGTEYSGPTAAVENAFEDKAVILCDASESDPDALEMATEIFKALKMRIIEMDANDHDLHAAYVSHISHITSFALANTVLEKEKEDNAIFEMASAGFESTVRLAKSSPEMWTPILMQNRENILDVLNEHITQLRKFKSCLEKENWEYLNELMSKANQIRRIIH
ncbi:MAG: prephenate dehydrogenase [Chitinophagaceae bacterium]|jgi:prephenate dehydrogenase|nr:prephenate dehydrogenase [Chitinophagaceae bacterium]